MTPDLDPLTLTVERDHLVHATTYDADLNPVSGSVAPLSGRQMNGHRGDCRCKTCRPDIP